MEVGVLGVICLLVSDRGFAYFAGDEADGADN
jgi:hypothetical protein